MKHEDNRRKLEDFPEGKLITAKEDCVVGNHYHKIKTEMFVLSSGACMFRKTVLGRTFEMDLEIGELITCYPYEYHEFHLKKGSVLIGLCSHLYDPNDEIK
jgi:hypothetical protein